MTLALASLNVARISFSWFFVNGSELSAEIWATTIMYIGIRMRVGVRVGG